MANLNYQPADDATREQRARLRLKLFGLSSGDVWNALAGELGGTYRKAHWYDRPRVEVTVGHWQITLDVLTDGEHTFTRLRSPYINADGFRFLVFRNHLFSPLAAKLEF